MTLLIDADWLIYNSCCACEEDTRWTEHEHTLHSDERDVMNLIDSRIDVFKTIAVASSTISLTAAKSPKDDIGSALRARKYAIANGVNSFPTTSYAVASSAVNGTCTAAPAGLTCLNDAAAGRFNDLFNSNTNCHAFAASSKLI